MSRRIPLHRRDGSIRAYAIVDASDFALVKQHKWCIQSEGYVARRKGPRGAQRTIYLHNFLLGGMTDHINGDPLDNRRKNLRRTTPALNSQNQRLRSNNTSGYRGVHRAGRKWRAFASLGGKQHNLGTFDSPEAAHVIVSAWRAEHMPFSEDARRAA